MSSLDPDTAPEVEVDRFSESAATLMLRTPENGLPGAGEPIDFDRPPFITRGLGPDGRSVAYYNFDVQSPQPAPIYVFFREGEPDPVPGQLNVVDTIPGADDYNDFWRIHRVSVPASYMPNSVTRLEQVEDAGYTITPTEMLVNCPIVPDGSSARQRLGSGSTALARGWYRDQIVHYFSFEEHPLSGTRVPVAPIYVAFAINPDQPGGGPGSGFRTETGSEQTHNVIAAVPGEAGYSPLWSVSPYDNAEFEQVRDLPSASGATILARDVATVNCPVVEAGE